MSTLFDAAADAELQELYDLASPGPCSYRPGYPLEMLREVDRDAAAPLVQACGVLYERDAVSLITDREYDRLAGWLGDSAATAMDWQTYPPEVRALADRLRDAAEWRSSVLTGAAPCSGCSKGACSCTCEAWSWA